MSILIFSYMHIKRFLEWIGVKKALHSSEQVIPLVSEGQIWWASLGENVGYEINGKSRLFTRPVLIFKKLSDQFYLVVPLTSQKKVGSWYVNYRQRGEDFSACIHQIRTIDYRRLSTRLGWFDERDFARIKDGFIKLYL